MVIPPLIGNPYNGYINPYYWVDDHPLLYGNNGSLDPGTCRTWNWNIQSATKGHCNQTLRVTETFESSLMINCLQGDVCWKPAFQCKYLPILHPPPISLNMSCWEKNKHIPFPNYYHLLSHFGPWNKRLNYRWLNMTSWSHSWRSPTTFERVTFSPSQKKPPAEFQGLSSWWFFPNPSEKYAQVKLDHLPRDRGKNKKIFELPPPSFVFVYTPED